MTFSRMTLPSLLLTAAMSISHAANAGDNGSTPSQMPPAGDRYAKFCEATPSLRAYGHPGNKHVHPSNKLARPAGKSIFADGQRLYVTGRVFDSACVPLRDARVELWHADASGEYRIADDGDMANPYPIFAGAGHVRTDNRGEYIFETIMPGAKAKQAPVINVRISHPAMRSSLTTAIFFEGDPRNDTDARYRRLSEARKGLVTGHVLPYSMDDVNDGLRLHHDITVSGRDGFRGF